MHLASQTASDRPIHGKTLESPQLGLPIRTFVLELAAIKLLDGKKNKSISTQMEHFWTELRDNSANLSVEDPANPNGNDLPSASMTI